MELLCIRFCICGHCLRTSSLQSQTQFDSVKYLIRGVSDSERPQCVVSEGLTAFQGHLVWAVFLLALLRPVLLTFGLRRQQMTIRDV